MVAVVPPVPRPQMHFNIALYQALPFHQQQGVAEIRPGGYARPARIQNLHPTPAFGTQSPAARRAPLPEPRQLLFGNRVYRHKIGAGSGIRRQLAGRFSVIGSIGIGYVGNDIGVRLPRSRYVYHCGSPTVQRPLSLRSVSKPAV